jgi:hypothetical protein
VAHFRRHIPSLVWIAGSEPDIERGFVMKAIVLSCVAAIGLFLSGERAQAGHYCGGYGGGYGGGFNGGYGGYYGGYGGGYNSYYRSSYGYGSYPRSFNYGSYYGGGYGNCGRGFSIGYRW